MSQGTVMATKQSSGGLMPAAAAAVEAVTGGPDWLVALRQEAWRRFQVRGIPTTKDEAWKYTDASALGRLDCRPAAAWSGASSWLRSTRWQDVTPRIVIANGRFDAQASDVSSLPNGLRVESLATRLARDPSALEPHLGRLVDAKANPFADLNAAAFVDGACIQVAPGVVAEDPILVVYVDDSPQGSALSMPRSIVLLEKGAHANLVEVFATASGAPVTVPVTEIVLGDGAVLRHAKIQVASPEAYHIAASAARQGRDATYEQFHACFGAALARTDLGTRFHGPGGHATLDGLYMVGGRQHVDNHTTIDHAVPHCSSRELYKGILDGTARGVFHGKVDIRKDAQKSDSDQHNPNLILSKGALVDSTPALEIFADDVKAAHGSTIGQLDEASVFYLRSRGLSPDVARGLLTYGFAKEAVDRVPIPMLRARLDQMVRRRLPGAQLLQGTWDDGQD